MPFKKVGKNDYTGPSGRHFNQAQVRLYYAHGGQFPAHANGGSVMAFPLTPSGKKVVPSKPAPSGGEQAEQPAYAKGGPAKVASYAKGGPVLGRTREFMKEPDEFRERDHGNPAADDDQKYGKDGPGKGTGVKPALKAYHGPECKCKKCVG